MPDKRKLSAGEEQHLHEKEYDNKAKKEGKVGIEFATGSRRKSLASVRYDLVSSIGLRRLAETYAEGAEIYGDHNWELGQPFSDIINHLQAHLERYKEIHRLGIERVLDKQGMRVLDEDHLAHAAWGLFALMHLEQTMPEMNDLRANPPEKKKEEVMHTGSRRNI